MIMQSDGFNNYAGQAYRDLNLALYPSHFGIRFSRSIDQGIQYNALQTTVPRPQKHPRSYGHVVIAGHRYEN